MNLSEKIDILIDEIKGLRSEIKNLSDVLNSRKEILDQGKDTINTINGMFGMFLQGVKEEPTLVEVSSDEEEEVEAITENPFN